MKFSELRCSYGERAEACGNCPFIDLAADMPDLLTHMKSMIESNGLRRIQEAIEREGREYDSLHYEHMVVAAGSGPDKYDEGDKIERVAIKNLAFCHGIE